MPSDPLSEAQIPGATPHVMVSSFKTTCPGLDKILPNFLYRLREVDLAITVSESVGKQHVKMIRLPGGLTTRKLGALRSRALCGWGRSTYLAASASLLTPPELD